MTPSKVWKINKTRIDLRQVTRQFERRFRVKSKGLIEPGKVYAMRYQPDNSNHTDKFHITPVILSLGHFVKNDIVYIKGINLFYLSTGDALGILEDAFKVVNMKPIQRNAHINTIHDKYINTLEYNYKYFDTNRIISYNEVQSEEWGFIPLLHKNLFGNFNIEALINTYKKEIGKNKQIKIKKENVKKDDKVESVSEIVEMNEPLTLDQIFE